MTNDDLREKVRQFLEKRIDSRFKSETYMPQSVDEITGFLTAALAEERERCATVAHDFIVFDQTTGAADAVYAEEYAHTVAAAIRSQKG